MSDILIIGYGNELRGDDGIGPYIVRGIDECAWPGVRCLALQQLTPDLADAVAGSRVVIFVDACANAQTAAIAVQEMVPDGADLPSSHGSDPLGILALARAIYGRMPRAWLVSVTATQFDVGAELSETVRRHAALAIEAIKELLDRAGPADASTNRR